MKSIPACLLLLAASLPAQKMLLPADSGRQLQLFDLWSLEPNAESEHEVDGANPDQDLPEGPALGVFLQRFVDPPLTAHDAITTLGGRWLAVLGTPEQVACVDRLFTIGKQRRHDLICIEVHLLRMPTKVFDSLLRPQLTASQRGDEKTFEAVMPGNAASELLAQLQKSGAESLQSPSLTTRPLQSGEISITNRTSYIKDFSLVRNGDQVIADPIVDTVWDGVRSNVRATFLPGGMIGVACEVTCQEVERPIATFSTTLDAAAKPVSIQLPRVTGTHLQQTARIGEGDAVVLGAQRIDGSFLVALVMAKPMPAPK